MLTSIAQNPSSVYNTISSVQNNAVLNRGLMESLGIEIPYSLMANNKDERIERLSRAVCFILGSFVAPVITMPLINRVVLNKVIKDIKPEEKVVLKVSKKYLTKGADYMIKGFNKTKSEIEKNIKHKNQAESFTDVLIKYKGREEELRQKLIKAHQHIFSLDFLVASWLVVSNHWVNNYFTEKRTKRSGYVGEFKMAEENYTDKMAENHEKTKKIKMCASYLIAAASAVLFPRLLAKSTLLPADRLNPITKFFKNSAHHFDYKNSIYASQAALFSVMLLGDTPSFIMSCRDKHETKYKTTGLAFMFLMLFGGEPLLNNMTGRFSDKHFGTNLMNTKGYEKAGFFKKMLMPVKSLQDINHSSASNHTKKTALGMYMGNFVLTTVLLGIGLPFILNNILKKDVAKDKKLYSAQKQTAITDMKTFLKNIQPEADKIYTNLSNFA